MTQCGRSISLPIVVSSGTSLETPTTTATEPRGVGFLGQAAVVLAAGTGLLPWLWEIPFTQSVLCFLQIAITVSGLIRSVAPLRPTAMIAFGFTFSWLGVAPIYQLSHGLAAWGDSEVLYTPEVEFALVLNVLAAAAMYFGFFSTGRAGRHVSPAGPDEERSPRRIYPALFLLACLALTPRAIAANGGLGALFSSRSDRSVIRAAQGLTTDQAGGLAVALVSYLPTALAVAAAYLLVLRLRPQVRAGGLGGASVLDAAMFCVAIFLMAVFANPFTNTRAIAASAFAPLAILILQPRSARAGRYMLAVVLAATFVAYPLANVFRDGEGVQVDGFDVFASVDFDGFQQVINSEFFVDDSGHSWGHYSSSAALYFVPRAIWNGKADPASIDVAANRGYWFTNLSLPFHAEMYVEFGIVGMVLIVFWLARLGRRLDWAWLTDPRSTAGLLAPYVAVSTLLILRGPLGSLVPVYLTTAGLIFLGVRRQQTTAGASKPAGVGIRR